MTGATVLGAFGCIVWVSGSSRAPGIVVWSGLGFGVWGLGFRVEGLRFRVSGFGSKLHGSGRDRGGARLLTSGFRV